VYFLILAATARSVASFVTAEAEDIAPKLRQAVVCETQVKSTAIGSAFPQAETRTSAGISSGRLGMACSALTEYPAAWKMAKAVYFRAVCPRAAHPLRVQVTA
jgi:hypothetical protein